MKTHDTHYTIDKADIIVQAIANGHTTIQAAHMAGICHMTAYNWRHKYPEFAERWREAVEIATDCVESVVAHAAMSGNLTAAFYWLRHHRPRVYNRESLAKLAMLQAAISAQAARGGGRLTIQIDENGIPQIAENEQKRVVVYLPENDRAKVIDGDPEPPAPTTETPQPPKEAEPKEPEPRYEWVKDADGRLIKRRVPTAAPERQQQPEPEIISPNDPEPNVIPIWPITTPMSRFKALSE